MENNKILVATLVVGYLETNCYLVYEAGSKNAFIVDPGAEPEAIQERIASLSLKPLGIINTHGHIDHIGADSTLKASYNVPIYIHKYDEKFLSDSSFNGSVFFGEEKKFQKADVILENNSLIKKGSLEFRVVHTPGHTPGGICLLIGGMVFSGDTLFKDSVGRWDLPGGNESALRESLKIFSTMPITTTVFPGHGEKTTIGEELKNNPYLTQVGSI